MTTTKVLKVEKTPKKPRRFSFLRLLAAEMRRLTGKTWDPGYLSNLVTGSKVNKTLDEKGTLKKALANLAAKGVAPSA